MRTLNMFQGSKEWYAERSRRFTASEAPAMMGASKYQSRDELLYQKATGIVPEVTEAKQALFDRGHRAEAAARRIVEDMLGQDLYPVTAVSDEDDRLLASLDGCTIDETTLYEHKLWSEGLAAQVRARDLEPHYYWQLEQQLLVAGAEKVIFVCSDGTPEKFASMEYRPVPGRADALRAGWDQFAADLAAYVPPAAAAPTATGRTPENLPALHIEVTGHVTASNLREYKERALAVFAGINRNLATDQDFADAEQAVKWCADVESRLAAAKQHALSQTASIDELFRTVDEISAEARRVRLDLDKLVKAEKEHRRLEIVGAGRAALSAHITELNNVIGFRFMPDVQADFAGAIKGKKSLDSMRSAVNDELARAKIAANEIADRITLNLRTLGEHVEYVSLFPDTATLVLKTPDDLLSTVKSRIADHQAAEAKKAEVAAQAQQAIQQAAEPAAAPAAPAPAPWDADEAATLKLGDVNARLTPIQVTADGLRELGIEPAVRDKRAVQAQFEKLLSDSGRACLYEGDGQYAYPHDFAWLCYQAGHAAAKAETAWIPVAVLPAPCLKVIATYANSLGNRRTIMAKWVPGKTEEAHSLDDEFGEYDEATDTTYAPEGWYEVIDNFDDCTFVAVSEGVITHWMPLPEAPDAIRAGAKEASDA